MIKYLLLISAIYACLAPSLPSRALAETGVADHEILIGSGGPVTGESKDIGLRARAGLGAYVKYVNEKGGVYGRKIRLIFCDDQYDPSMAIACFKQMQEQGVFAFAAMAGAVAAVKYGEMAQTYKIPIAGVLGGPDLLYKPVKRYILLVAHSYSDEVATDVNHLWEEAGLRKFAIFYQNDALGIGVLNGVNEALARHGASPTMQASFDRTHVSEGLAATLAKFRAAKPQVMIVAATLAPAVEIANAIKASGWNPQLIPIPAPDYIFEKLGSKAEGTIFTMNTPPLSHVELKGVAFYRKLLKQYEPQARPDTIGFGAFSDAILLVEGLKRAGKDLTREGFVDAVESIQNLDIGFGSNTLTYSPDNHVGLRSPFYAVVRGGKLVDISDWSQFAR